MNPKYSVIIPVYNRPDELKELLESLCLQTFTNFEVIIVEDGSTKDAREVVESFNTKLSISYFVKKNEGPGPARNFGYQHARGQYLIVFDSDCIIPAGYFVAVEHALKSQNLDAWGGPDRAHKNFTLLQRAMGYTMSSVLTTGGIRGGKKRVGWFQPRSFNMGISAKVYQQTNGFAFSRFAEDIEFSIRIRNAGFKVGLIEDAFVYHKRRTDFSQFFKQVFNFGKGRALLGLVHPSEIKLTHWFPSIFTLALFSLVILPFTYYPLFLVGAVGFSIYFLAIFIHAVVVNKDFTVAIMSVPSAFLQLTGYGTGFIYQRIKNLFH